MSMIQVAQVRSYLRVLHTSDDALLQGLIDSAEDECLSYLDREELPRRGDYDEACDSNAPDPVSDSDDLAPSIRAGCYLIIQAMYEGATADEIEKVRRVAEVKWHPYRDNLGA